MTITVEATYENGMLRPAQQLPLREHETVEIQIRTSQGISEPTMASPADVRHQALQRLLAMNLPVADWDQMEQEIIRGAIEQMSAPLIPAMLDTAIPMYAAGAPHPYRDACQWLMSDIAAGRVQVVIDAELIQEILHRYGALGRYADAVNMAQDVMRLVPQVLPVTAADIQTAVAMFQQYGPQGVRARDTIHAAVMQNHGITHVISSDTHFDLISGLTRLDPIALHHSGN